MQYIYGTTNIKQNKDSVVVLGNFDGVHIGHQKLFEVAKRKAAEEDLQVVVLSFYPPPTWILGKQPKKLLMSREDKKDKIESIGIDVLIEYPFTREFSNMSPEDFFTCILKDQLSARILVIGSNYYFGKGKTADALYMQKLGKNYNVEICVIDTIKSDNIEVSSSYIRTLVQDGAIEKANLLLGHPYCMSGTVIDGKKLGRQIGFPTINIIPDPNRAHPPNGVYATTTKINNKIYWSITNIGYNPTVNGENKIIETHIFDFSHMIYGVDVKIYFYKYIRKETKFNSIDLLKNQIEKDKNETQKILKMFLK